MARMIKKLSKAKGLPPGSIVHIGAQSSEKTEITLFDYDSKKCIEKTLENVEDCFPFKDSSAVTWININGIHNTDSIVKIDQKFGIHPLVLEDIVNTGQRPKIEDYGDYMFIILKILTLDEKSDHINSEQISLIVGSNYCLSFQEKKGHFFDSIRERIRHDKGVIRKMKSDYLAFCLIDMIIDHYFEVIEELGEKIENTETQITESTQKTDSSKIHHYKKEMIFLRKQIWPLREVLNTFYRSDSKLIRKETRLYLKDVYDHTIQILDTIESYRDMLTGMHDIYLTSISNRMNEVMKVLTIFASIFIPLTFIAGVYGMNFKFMPELEWHYGYFMVLSVMFAVAFGLLVYFKKKEWI